MPLPTSSIYASIRATYRTLPFLQRLFVYVRCQVVPWRKLLDVLDVASLGTLLDLGCGHGLFLQLVHVAYPDARCWGVEHDEKKLQTIEALAGNPSVTCLSWEAFEQNNPGKVNCVSIIDVLCCIPLKDWGSILHLAAEQLQPGGFLLVKDCIDRPRWKYRVTNIQEIGAARVFRYTKGAWPHHESVDCFIKKIEDNGFKVTRHERIDQGYPWSHYYFLAQKVTA
jgi:cyclopropane fatty-acyl-phospholipid synthase-like methyltransferase